MRRGLVKWALWQTLVFAYCLAVSWLWLGSVEAMGLSAFLCGSLVPAVYLYDKIWSERGLGNVG